MQMILIAETMQKLKERLNNWKRLLESKGLKGNVNKTKVKVCKQGEQWKKVEGT